MLPFSPVAGGGLTEAGVAVHFRADLVIHFSGRTLGPCISPPPLPRAALLSASALTQLWGCEQRWRGTCLECSRPFWEQLHKGVTCHLYVLPRTAQGLQALLPGGPEGICRTECSLGTLKLTWPLGYHVLEPHLNPDLNRSNLNQRKFHRPSTIGA